MYFALVIAGLLNRRLTVAGRENLVVPVYEKLTDVFQIRSVVVNHNNCLLIVLGYGRLVH
jgi:hypothetical protein